MSKKATKTGSIQSNLEDTPARSVYQQTELIWADTKNGKILASIDNLKRLTDFLSIKVRYNLISKELEITIPGFDFSLDNRLPASVAFIASEIRKSGMLIEGYKENLCFIGEMDKVNPVLDWITSKQWDGVSRIEELCSTIKAKDNESKNIFIERWLYQAVALAMYNKTDAAGILVLQGPQGLGKSWWFRQMAPEHLEIVKTGSRINPNDRDSVSQNIRYWIVELGEIGSTFRRTDIDALKAFLTEPVDVLRRPYGSGDQSYPRRTAFAASVNPETYLYDDTGNRRFWTVACTEINSYHKINMQQLWAEIHHHLIAGKEWRITPQERALVDKINENHMQTEPLEEMILTKYYWEGYILEWKTATEIAEQIGVKNIDSRVTRKIGEIVKRLNVGVKDSVKRSAGKNLMLMPALK